MKKKEFVWMTLFFSVLGAINWGLYGVLGVDLVRAMLSTSPTLMQIVYAVIGFSGVYQLYILIIVKK